MILWLWRCLAGDVVDRAGYGENGVGFWSGGRVCDWYRRKIVCFVPQKLNIVVKTGTFGIESQKACFDIEQKQGLGVAIAEQDGPRKGLFRGAFGLLISMWIKNRAGCRLGPLFRRTRHQGQAAV
ncbi:hypothetical protein [Brytella acorum]|uniref:Uncharacterized protein n=1 Tax=Brytella acorum TaxID=2959299 RepID=A0AA35UIW7_9PROT|nr:hypothetical protein [Brytella acorum]CAI9122360.1 hypothetical protein LMG32879_003226 [Brytella acorum]